MTLPCKAQYTDPVKHNYDTTAVIKSKPIPNHSPKKAALLSLVPGVGQIYNKKYWKLPIIYIGYGALAYSFQFNQSEYVKFRNALRNNLNGVPDQYTNDPRYTAERLEVYYKHYHRLRDLTVIGGLALYVLNIVDAAVDAHMYTFNVSDDLSMSIHPTLINTAAGYNHYTGGLGLNIKF